MVNPGVHSVPAGPQDPDLGAGGTSVTEVLFPGPGDLTAASKLGQGARTRADVPGLAEVSLRQLFPVKSLRPDFVTG